MAYDEHLANRIRELIGGDPEVTEKKMFGGLAFLVAGNMAVSASGQGGLMVRVDPEPPTLSSPSPMLGHSRCAAGRWRAGCESMPTACAPNVSSSPG